MGPQAHRDWPYVRQRTEGGWRSLQTHEVRITITTGVPLLQDGVGLRYMEGSPNTVLLVSNDAADTGLVRKTLAAIPDNQWRLESVARLAEGVERIRQGGVAAVLLDLTLFDSDGIATFEAIFDAAPLIPILILASPENERTAWKAVRLGAQDHVLKDHLDAYWLPRILRSI